MSRNKDAETVGRTYGRLTAVSVANCGYSLTRKRSYLCSCTCGGSITTSGTSLRNGNTKSCGCVAREKTVARCTKHGHATRSGSLPEYEAWNMTKQRCENPNQRDYKRYGARGITVCDRWRCFESFLADMGRRPPGYTLERRDNNLGYEPSNCVWATRKSQSSNRYNTVRVTCWGQTKTVPEWAEYTGVKASTLRARLGRLGYSPEVALSKPVKAGKRP